VIVNLKFFRMLGQAREQKKLPRNECGSAYRQHFKNRIKEKLKMKNSTETILYALTWFSARASEIKKQIALALGA